MATKSRAEYRNGKSKVTSEILDRLPPQNLEAERGVLGSLLLDPHCCDEVSLHLRADDFHVDANRLLYTHLLDMHNEGVTIDALLLVERLNRHGDLERAGGMAYLTEVAQSVPTAANAVHYARIVHDKATLRSLIHACTEVLRDAYDHSQEARDLLARAEETVFKILETQSVNQALPMRDVLKEALARLDTRLARGEGVGATPTGFTDFDALTGGLHDSELVILAARPSMGKTALACNIAEHVAIECNRATLFVSLEMSRLELAERMLCSRGRINSHKLRSGFVSPTDRRKLVDVFSQMSEAPLYIDDSPTRSVSEIAATARRFKRRCNLGLVVVDYLQMIEPDNPKDPRHEQVGKMARRLKGLAREIRIPVLCLAQLNRQAEATKDNRPRLNHLRESGAI
jgi:replicative DNA helicase